MEAFRSVLDPQFILNSVAGVFAIAFAGLYLSGKNKNLATNALLILGTIFVGLTLGKSIFVENKLAKNSSSLDSDRAEMMLRINSSCERAMSSVMPVAAPLRKSAQPDVYGEAEKVLRKAADFDKSSTNIWSKLVVTDFESKHKSHDDLNHLVEISKAQNKAIGPALAKIYAKSAGERITADQAKDIGAAIEKEMPAGWYRNASLLELYRVSGQTAKLTQLNADLDQKAVTLVAKLVGLVAFGAVAVLVGVIVIFSQLLFIARRITSPADKVLVEAPVDYGWKSIYAVFLAWQVTQLLIGMAAGTALKSGSAASAMLKTAASGENGVLFTGCLMAVFYCISNGPSLLYAWLFAMRPHGVKFFEGLKLRLQVGRTGLGQLILIGLLTWFAAIPFVLITVFVTMKIGSQGSTNPVIGLVMEAARSPNILATSIFYMTLGGLAPLCEEALFRGFLYGSLRRKLAVVPSILISAFLFAACHFDAGGFGPLFTLGCIFAFVFERTKSIVPSMVAHGLWNSGTFTIVLILFGS